MISSHNNISHKDNPQNIDTDFKGSQLIRVLVNVGQIDIPWDISILKEALFQDFL